MLAVE